MKASSGRLRSEAGLRAQEAQALAKEHCLDYYEASATRDGFSEARAGWGVGAQPSNDGPMEEFPFVELLRKPKELSGSRWHSVTLESAVP